MKINFRLGKKEDQKAIGEIAADININYQRELNKAFNALISSKSMLLVTKDEKILGYVHWENKFLGKNDCWYLEQITIDRKWRRKNIGSQLVRKYINLARKNKIRSIFLDIDDKNFSSLSLFQNEGAVISGTVNGLKKDFGEANRIIFRFDIK